MSHRTPQNPPPRPAQPGDVIRMYAPIDDRPYKVFTQLSSVTGPSESNMKLHQYVVFQVDRAANTLDAFARSSFSDRSIGAEYATLSSNYENRQKFLNEKATIYENAKTEYNNTCNPPKDSQLDQMRRARYNQWSGECRRARMARDTAQTVYDKARRDFVAVEAAYNRCQELVKDCIPAGSLAPEDARAQIYTQEQVVRIYREEPNPRGYWNIAFVVTVNLKLNTHRTIDRCTGDEMAPIVDYGNAI
ncbi:hypothetical protein BD410DRAFT_831522 [Rickenella mellea]|uniref:Uncharacterized protein n=1 Tax=Rickenella mellea TaxID=50990 RepID=A0A4Y7PPT7_9AGAM|nr:hypothetical protein BD410DRAFT_831522 [Rickenella mellea]